MSAEKLMTEAEFVSAMKTWTSGVYFRSRASLQQTHGSGELRNRLERYVDPLRNAEGYKIAFRFPRHGVFRHYGAGRGWVIVNGRPVRGERILSLREIQEKRANATAQAMLKRGDSLREVRRTKVTYDRLSKAVRTPLDWLDGHITARMEALADMAVEYYGDHALRNVLKEIDKAKIVKPSD